MVYENDTKTTRDGGRPGNQYDTTLEERPHRRTGNVGRKKSIEGRYEDFV